MEEAWNSKAVSYTSWKLNSWLIASELIRITYYFVAIRFITITLSRIMDLKKSVSVFCFCTILQENDIFFFYKFHFFDDKKGGNGNSQSVGPGS